jgi:hypothetical protein
MKTSRRQFLIASALTPVAYRLAAADGPAMHFPTAAKDRLAVASYPFRASIDTPRNRTRNPTATLIDLKEFPAQVAQRFKLHNVELLGEHIRSTEPAYLEQLRAAARVWRWSRSMARRRM